MSEDWTCSRLGATGNTHTPAKVMAYARHICDLLREHFGLVRLTLDIQPFTDEVLTVFVRSFGCDSAMLLFTVGQPYHLSAGISLAPSNMVGIYVPDLPEALHLLGIICEGLNATVNSFGTLDKEANPEVLDGPLTSYRHLGRIAFCDHFRDPPALSIDASAESMSWTTGRTRTPVQTFNQASSLVERARSALQGIRLRARLWGYRYSAPCGSAAEDGDGSGFKQKPKGQRLVLTLIDEGGCSFTMVFSSKENCAAGEEYTFGHLMESMHLAAMVIDTVGAQVSQIGNQNSETNAELLQVPSSSAGKMVNAANYVPQLPPPLADAHLSTNELT